MERLKIKRLLNKTSANSGFASAGGDETQHQLLVHYSSAVVGVTERR